MEEDIVIYEEETMKAWDPISRSWRDYVTNSCGLPKRDIKRVQREIKQLRTWYPKAQLNYESLVDAERLLFNYRKNRGMINI